MWAKQKVDLDTSNRRTDSPRAPPQEPARRELLLAGRCWVGECRPESGDLLSVCDVSPPPSPQPPNTPLKWVLSLPDLSQTTLNYTLRVNLEEGEP